MKIDNLDHQIIHLLLEDGRMECAAMARRLDVPARTVRYRLNRLLENDVVQVCAVVNPRAFGYRVVADVLIETEAGQTHDVAQATAELEHVSYVACSIGDRDVSIQVFARDTDELYSFVTDVIHNIPGVRRTRTHLLPVTLKDVYHWYPPNSKS